MLKKALWLGVLPVLAACGATAQSQTAQQSDATPPMGNSAATVFICDNGLQVAVQQRGVDAVHLEVTGEGVTESKTAVLQRAVSASGERYAADNGAEWHQKGSEAYFAYGNIQVEANGLRHGVGEETVCREKQ
ncbi:membrane-bound inhibitor of C-type lysozyme [Neisseria sp. HSC-16F19]|nr:MliC family protein [Neisseria sp. HSC-16F19]MCP2040166.1 membrane-bound inhibitor of C-type lysozyme [Neisseria sp. HSC-16F19]